MTLPKYLSTANYLALPAYYLRVIHFVPPKLALSNNYLFILLLVLDHDPLLDLLRSLIPLLRNLDLAEP